MIDSKYLMLGNLVKSNNPKYRPNEVGKFLYVTKIDSENDSIGCFVYQELPFAINFGQYTKFIEPILLTEEILLKCGFGVVTESSAGKRYAYLNNGIFSSDLAFTYWVIGKTKNKFFRGDLECKYVHELQNLYKALSGKELKINL